MFLIEDRKPTAQEQGYRTSSCSTSCVHCLAGVTRKKKLRWRGKNSYTKIWGRWYSSSTTFGALLCSAFLENGQLIFPSNGDGGVASVLRVTLLGVRKPTTSARFLWLSYSLMFLVVKCTSSTKNDTVFVFGSISRSRPTTEPV